MLYSVAIFEILLGLCFLASLLPMSWRMMLIMFNFLASMAIFVFFCFGDILFGDRAELLEHATYLILVLATFSLLFGAKQRARTWEDMTIRLMRMTSRRTGSSRS